MQANSSGSSSGDNGAHNVQEEYAPASQGNSAHTAGSTNRGRRSRTQTKWPEDKVIATGLDDQWIPTPKVARDRFILVCGLIARERVSINANLEDFTLEQKQALFPALEEKLEYPPMSEGVGDKEIKAAVIKIGEL